MSTSLSEFEPLSLMISSRCSDKVTLQNKQVAMGKLRKAIKDAIEQIQPSGKILFDVWIHEDESHSQGSQNTWDTCMAKARQADVVLVLYNGRAGWPGTAKRLGDGIGICHAEFEEAFHSAPSKVRSIQFPAKPAKPDSPDGRFQEYFIRQNLPGTQVQTGDEAIEAAKELAVATLLSLARTGVGVSSTGGFYAGEALEWSRLDFQSRRTVTRKAVAELISGRGKTDLLASDPPIAILNVRNHPIAFLCDCIPASLGTSAARELVGQPFLHDHEYVSLLPPKVCGPVHIIACQKGVSESQALRQLGFPDAIVVNAPFGVYVADNVQKIQMVFIAQCRDESSTRRHTQRFLNWLAEQGEDDLLADRADSRRRIADLLAKES